MPKLVTTRRIQAVRKLSMFQVEVSEELLQAGLENQGIRELEIVGIDVPELLLDLFARSIAKMAAVPAPKEWPTSTNSYLDVSQAWNRES